MPDILGAKIYDIFVDEEAIAAYSFPVFQQDVDISVSDRILLCMLDEKEFPSDVPPDNGSRR